MMQFNSVEDHHQDVMCFCWENGYHGVMADDSEYALVNPPRFFSAKSLKMTFQVYCLYSMSTVHYCMYTMSCRSLTSHLWNSCWTKLPARST